MSILNLIKSNTTTTTTTEVTTMTTTNTMKELLAHYNTLATVERAGFKNKQAAVDAINALTPVTIEAPKEEETMNEVNVEEHELAPINENALSSTMAAQLFLHLGNARQAVKLACAVVSAVTKTRTGNQAPFIELVKSSWSNASLTTRFIQDGPITTLFKENKLAAREAKKMFTPSDELLKQVRDEKGSIVEQEHEVEMTEEAMCNVLGRAKYLANDGGMGAMVIELTEQRKEAYAPTPVNAPFVRKFKLMGLEKGQLSQASALAVSAIHAQEKSVATVDSVMLNICNRVQANLDKFGKAFEDKEAYVLSGCNKLDPAQGYVSEFTFDNRLRTYQAACHGYNGQSSDRSRSLMQLRGVSTNYNKEAVTTIIMAEVEDMVSIAKTSKLTLTDYLAQACANPIDWTTSQLKMTKAFREVKKVYSFVKAALLLEQLANHVEGTELPYIGMAVGLDAKCSGPQYGALMAGSTELAKACGFAFTDEKLADAYQRCVASLDANGFKGFTRNSIKKTFMGVFYGQGFAAFMDIASLRKDEQFDVVKVLSQGESYITEATAKQFHKLVTASFGKEMVAIRNAVKKYTGVVEGRMGHFMPDGAKIQMNYKVKNDIFDQVVEFDSVCPDVVVSIGMQEFKFIKLALNTKVADSDNFVRTAFVNMIQGVDALIARLIVVHLERLGATHIVAVHDCFRVNVTEMHLLEQAIKNAYQDLFGSTTNEKTEDLPMGTDILGMFFEGLDECAFEKVSNTNMSQFDCGYRNFTKVGKHTVTDLIDNLGETYYFAK